MRLLPTSRFTRALTFTEVLFLVVVLLLLAALLLTFAIKWQARARVTQCQNNLSNVGMAFKVWANDKDDKFPYFTTNCLAYTNETQAWLHYFVMSNEIGSARILTCPQDAARLTNMVMDFNSGPTGLLTKTNRAVTYFVGLEAEEIYPTALLVGDRNLMAASSSSNPRVLLLATNASFRWGLDLHTNHGNIAFADGSVQDLDRWGLQAQLTLGMRGTGLETNRLLMPVVPP